MLPVRRIMRPVGSTVAQLALSSSMFTALEIMTEWPVLQTFNQLFDITVTLT